MSDVDAVINPQSGFPLIEVYYQATQHKAATVVLLVGFAFCLFGSAVANVTGSSRQIWAASRDNCYPMSRWWKVIHPRCQMPLNAACLSAVFVTVRRPLFNVHEINGRILTDGLRSRQLYGLIFLGSSTAFASMVSANIVFMMTSYVIPQAIIAYRGRDRVLPERVLTLGSRTGLIINVTACVWVLFLNIIACFPTTLPVTAGNMNWVRSAML